MKPDISEIELGPHFITVWLKTSPVQLAEKMYYDFCAEHPDLALIQQDRFGHEPNDPNVYHPYGEPNEVRPEGPWKHFHVRYGYEPGAGDIMSLTRLLNKHANTSEAGITLLTDRVVREFSYPEIPDNHEDYLAMIDGLRDK